MPRHHRGIPEDVALRTALEVASVKAQVQGILRRLRADLDELEHEMGRLTDSDLDSDSDSDSDLDGTGDEGGSDEPVGG